MGNVNVWRVRPQSPGQPWQREPRAVDHSGTYNADPFVSPDGKYLIYSSDRRRLRWRGPFCDLTNGNGGWTAPVNLNQYCPGINTDAIEYGPSLSPDQRYLFFVRLNYNDSAV